MSEEVKDDVWKMTSILEVEEVVSFNRKVTAEEAKTLREAREQEDIIDTQGETIIKVKKVYQ